MIFKQIFIKHCRRFIKQSLIGIYRHRHRNTDTETQPHKERRHLFKHTDENNAIQWQNLDNRNII